MGKAQLQSTVSNTPSFEQIMAMMDRTAKGYEEIRAMQKETDRVQKETWEQMKETDRKMQETDRQMKETDRQMKETDRQIKDINKRFGDYSNRLGEIAEYMIAPNLCEKFSELGHVFPKANKNTVVADYINDMHFEIDFLLENGDKAMLVEVKTNITSKDVNEHLDRLKKMRKYADLHGDKRAFLGSVAGVVIPKNIRNQALKHGFFVIEPSGETFNITSPPGKPKEW